VLAHVAGIPVEEALAAAPALLAGLTVFAGYVRAIAARLAPLTPPLLAMRQATPDDDAGGGSPAPPRHPARR
jgi:hypothetical protein